MSVATMTGGGSADAPAHPKAKKASVVARRGQLIVWRAPDSRDWQSDRGTVVSPGWFCIGRARHVVRGEVRSFDPYPDRNEPSLRIKVPSIQHQGPIMLLPEWAQVGAEALHQVHDSCHGDIARFAAARDLLQPSDSDDPSGTIIKIRRFLIEHSPDAPAGLAA